MSLADLIAKRRQQRVATATFAIPATQPSLSSASATAIHATFATPRTIGTESIAQIATVAIANSEALEAEVSGEQIEVADITAHRWLIYLPNENIDTVNSSPLKREDLLAEYPDAFTIEPHDPKPIRPSTPLGAQEEATLRRWLAYIDERDSESILEVLDRCRTDQSARSFFLGQANAIQDLRFGNDDRRYCGECLNLASTRRCLAAERNELSGTGLTYKPVDDVPRRCEHYLPNSIDPDHRPGHERWPELMPNLGERSHRNARKGQETADRYRYGAP